MVFTGVKSVWLCLEPRERLFLGFKTERGPFSLPVDSPSEHHVFPVSCTGEGHGLDDPFGIGRACSGSFFDLIINVLRVLQTGAGESSDFDD